MRILKQLCAVLLVAIVVGVPAAVATEIKALGEPDAVVYFGADSDELTPAAKKTLDGVRAAFEASGKERLAILAFSDPREYAEPGMGAQYGIGLSMRRGGNVRSYLWVSCDVPCPEDALEKASDFNSRMTVESHGETPPKGKGDRRRVEIFFTNEG